MFPAASFPVTRYINVDGICESILHHLNACTLAPPMQTETDSQRRRYYLFGTESYISKPLILVPLAQVQSLITDIQNEFEVDVSVPEYPFQIAFYNDGTPSPAYAGRVNSKRDFGDVQSKISYTSDSYGKLPSDVTEAQIRDNNAWNEKLDRANYAEKKKKGGKRIGKNRHVAFGQGSLERAQRHLGLRRSLVTAEVIRPKESIVQQPAETNDASLDLNAPVPYAFEDDVVVISIDVESWEMDHSAITEIGLSVLDTADIKSIAPGPRGEEWIKKIRSRHFRIKGRESLRNMKFCDGNPDMFQFGASEYVTIEAAPAMIDSCFEPPYSAAYQCEGPPRTDENGNFVPFVPAPANKFVRPEDEVELSRTLLLVGHGVEGDIAYLSALGSTIFSGGPVKSAGEDSPGRRQRILSSIRGQFDTATLYQALKKDSQMTSLTKMCIELGIDPWFAHNAGNDARYTLEAFVKLVIQSRQGDEKQDVGTKAEAVATAQFIPSSLPDTKTKAAGETYAVADTNKINWSGPTTTQEREWRPIFDRAYQSGGQIVASGDEGDSDGDVDVSADEMPY